MSALHETPAVAAASRDPRPDRQGGYALIEVAVAISAFGFAVITALGTMVSLSTLDQEVNERRVALRAAEAVLSEVTSYDYAGDIDDFVAHWSDPANAVIEVQGLTSAGAPSVDGNVFGGAEMGGISSASRLALQALETQDWNANAADIGEGRAFVVLNAADPERIEVLVSVRWGKDDGQRHLRLSTYVTEIAP